MRAWPWNTHPVICVRPGCGDPYSVHEAGGGECRSLHDGRPCLCPGFRWVPPEGSEHQGYRGPARREPA